MKTYVARPSEVVRKWYLVDATNLVLGRLAVILANYVRGKHKAIFTPNIDCGDNVVVVNAEKIKITGNKLNDHLHYWHTGYPGGIKSRSYSDTLEGKNPHKVIQLAVKRMVPKGPLGKQQLTKLHVYSGDKHPHEAQNPELIDLGIMNRKNKRDL
ncbi:MAG: 50S ribosomal protein L13 [Alphaproteobacteria bacterium MarineAlpha9_Bin2]|nr:MAG: 50S ribosomal protein L13 [Alphaproteobacteria bacterium MarineAlpha9_Bin2]